MRARIVIYNITLEQLKPLLTSIAMRLDPSSRWTNDSLLIPNLNVHLHVEPVGWLRNIQLTAGGNRQSYEGWQRLEKELVVAVGKLQVSANIVGIGMLIVSGVLAAVTAFWMIQETEAVAKAFEEMMQR